MEESHWFFLDVITIPQGKLGCFVQLTNKKKKAHHSLRVVVAYSQSCAPIVCNNASEQWTDFRIKVTMQQNFQSNFPSLVCSVCTDDKIA